MSGVGRRVGLSHRHTRPGREEQEDAGQQAGEHGWVSTRPTSPHEEQPQDWLVIHCNGSLTQKELYTKRASHRQRGDQIGSSSSPSQGTRMCRQVRGGGEGQGWSSAGHAQAWPPGDSGRDAGQPDLHFPTTRGQWGKRESTYSPGTLESSVAAWTRCSAWGRQERPSAAAAFLPLLGPFRLVSLFPLHMLL